MKYNSMFYLVIFFLFLNIVDIITTLKILPAESNPIFLLTGSLSLIFVTKILVMVGVFYFYQRGKFTSNMIYYIFISILVYSCLALLLAQIVNINAALNPQVLEQAAKATVSEKANSYATIMSIVYLIPVLLSWLTFFIYEKSIGNVTIKKKEKWWEL